MRNSKFKPPHFPPVVVATLALVCIFGRSAFAQEEAGSVNSMLPGEWLHWKMFNFRPRLATGVTYDDNIDLRRKDELQDIIWNVSPGILAEAGDRSAGEKFLSLDYAPNILKFTEHDEFDAVDHSAQLRGLLPFAKLTLGGSAGFQQLSTPEIELGIRVKRDLYTLALTSSYEVSPKTSLELNGSYHETDYGDRRFISSQEWTGQAWVNNQISSKVNVGFGLVGGLLQQDQGPSQIYERVLFRAIYTLTYKLDLTASVGGEWRQYQPFSHVTGIRIVITPTSTNTFPVVTQEKAASRFSPVFDIGATYRPREGTSLKLLAYRRDQNSPTIAGYNYLTTGISVSVRQRFWERFAVSFGGSLENSSYHSDLQNQTLDHDDNYYGVNAGLDALITQRWTAGVVIQHRSSDSNKPYGTIFKDNQVVLQTSYSF